MRRTALALAALFVAALWVSAPAPALAHSTARTAVAPLAVSDGTPAAARDPVPFHEAATSHTRPREGPAPRAEPGTRPPSNAPGWLALAAAGAAAAARWVRPLRRGLAVGLAPLLIVLGVESSVHAVHHLGDQASASECSVAGATAHLAGTLVDFASIDLRSGPVISLPLPRPRVTAATDAFRPDTGRAPPAA